jgi:hypothetical protein
MRLNKAGKWSNTSPKCAEIMLRKLQHFCITRSVALWSETILQNHNATVLQLVFPYNELKQVHYFCENNAPVK